MSNDGSKIEVTIKFDASQFVKVLNEIAGRFEITAVKLPEAGNPVGDMQRSLADDDALSDFIAVDRRIKYMMAPDGSGKIMVPLDVTVPPSTHCGILVVSKGLADSNPAMWEAIRRVAVLYDVRVFAGDYQVKFKSPMIPAMVPPISAELPMYVVSIGENEKGQAQVIAFDRI